MKFYKTLTFFLNRDISTEEKALFSFDFTDKSHVYELRYLSNQHKSHANF